MKLTIEPHVRSDGIRAVRAKAVINKSVKKNIPSRFQKTWTVRTVAPVFVSEEHRKLFEAEAKRWEARTIENIAYMEKLKAATENWNRIQLKHT